MRFQHARLIDRWNLWKLRVQDGDFGFGYIPTFKEFNELNYNENFDLIAKLYNYKKVQ